MQAGRSDAIAKHTEQKRLSQMLVMCHWAVLIEDDGKCGDEGFANYVMMVMMMV